MQLHFWLSGEISSRCSAYVGRRLQPVGAGLENGRCSPPARCMKVGIRCEKADLWQLLGGRGLPGGEEALNNEDKSKVLLGGGAAAAMKEDEAAVAGAAEAESAPVQQSSNAGEAAARVVAVNGSGAEGFEKEMMGLTGGFPGGETGLKRFVAASLSALKSLSLQQQPPPQQKPRAPAPPLLMPGMTVIVKNPRNPFYMYSGIVQRVSDGRVGVLFEGGNWDKLLTFYLEELERTATGPPMINPLSAILLERRPPAS